MDERTGAVTHTALRYVEAGEALTVSYLDTAGANAAGMWPAKKRQTEVNTKP